MAAADPRTRTLARGGWGGGSAASPAQAAAPLNGPHTPQSARARAGRAGLDSSTLGPSVLSILVPAAAPATATVLGGARRSFQFNGSFTFTCSTLLHAARSERVPMRVLCAGGVIFCASALVRCPALSGAAAAVARRHKSLTCVTSIFGIWYCHKYILYSYLYLSQKQRPGTRTRTCTGVRAQGRPAAASSHKHYARGRARGRGRELANQRERTRADVARVHAHGVRMLVRDDERAPVARQSEVARPR